VHGRADEAYNHAGFKMSKKWVYWWDKTATAPFYRSSNKRVSFRQEVV